MKRQTWTVVGGYSDRNTPPRHWVTLQGHTRPVPADEAFPEGTAVVFQNNRAVRAPS